MACTQASIQRHEYTTRPPGNYEEGDDMSGADASAVAAVAIHAAQASDGAGGSSGSKGLRACKTNEGCDTCGHYIKTVDLTKNGLAVPVVDELATIPLNLWAQEHGYVKLQANLLGI